MVGDIWPEKIPQVQIDVVLFSHLRNNNLSFSNPVNIRIIIILLKHRLLLCSQSSWFKRSKVRSRNLHFYQVHRGYWFYSSIGSSHCMHLFSLHILWMRKQKFQHNKWLQEFWFLFQAPSCKSKWCLERRSFSRLVIAGLSIIHS